MKKIRSVAVLFKKKSCRSRNVPERGRPTAAVIDVVVAKLAQALLPHRTSLSTTKRNRKHSASGVQTRWKYELPTPSLGLGSELTSVLLKTPPSMKVASPFNLPCTLVSFSPVVRPGEGRADWVSGNRTHAAFFSECWNRIFPEKTEHFCSKERI